MVPLLTVERGFIGMAGFALLLLLESVRPFRTPVESRWRRYLINLFIAGSNALLLSILLGGLIIAAYHGFELHRVGLLHQLGIGGWANVVLTVVLLDGLTYVWHRAYHGVPLMWRMHRVHHSDRDVDVTTSGRFHLTEMVLSAVFRFGVIAAWGASVASVAIFEIVFGLLNQLEHANLRIPEPFETWVRWVFVTPDMHRIHHSQVTEHTNSNYSTIFSWWDRLCGTYRFTTEQQALRVGLPEYRRPSDVVFGKVLAMPFGPPCAGRGRRSREGLAVTVGLALAMVAQAGVCSAEPIVLRQAQDDRPEPSRGAIVGQAAPDFTVADTKGTARSLSALKGRFVVLEWFNPECPFVKKHYGSRNMQWLQHAAAERGVVWLSIDSSAPGKQGYLTPDAAEAFMASQRAQPTAVLLDPRGILGRLYGAKTTPHMFIIDPEGRLRYAGAIDSVPSANPADIAEATNYVQRALDEAAAGKAVSVSQTKPYGCTVKY